MSANSATSSTSDEGAQSPHTDPDGHHGDGEGGVPNRDEFLSVNVIHEHIDPLVLFTQYALFGTHFPLGLRIFYIRF
jgi:hypothetical protein